LPVYQPADLRNPVVKAELAELAPDLMIVVAYGLILPKDVLRIPRLGCVNVHASLLPRWRGAAPIHRAILAGDDETGVTIMRVILALDAGDMIDRVRLPIDPNETSVALERRLALAGARLLVSVVDRLEGGPVRGAAQDKHQVTYAERIIRADGQVQWERPAHDIHNQIRGLHPWPHATAMLGDRRLLLIESRLEHTHTMNTTPGEVVESGPAGLVVAAAPGAVRLLRVQPEGRAAMQVRDFLNGRPVAVGDRLMTSTDRS
jgi:methionyl-tRNA formyltransferase